MRRALVFAAVLAACGDEPPPAPPPAAGPPAVTISGQLSFEDRRDGPTGPLEFFVAPLAGAELELVRPSDQSVLARGQTGPDGSYALAFESDGRSPVLVRILFRDLTGNLDLHLVDPDRRLHAVELPPLAPAAAQISQSVTLPRATNGRLANIFDAARRTQRFMVGLTGEQSPKVEVEWRLGFERDCITCYQNDTVFVSGTSREEDEYDDTVISHELGHFFADHYSRDDSGGGTHLGDYSSPPLAWSEGFATWYGNRVMGTPVYLDANPVGVFLEDLEGATDDWTYSTEDGSPAGDVSETLVGAVLWDMNDAQSDDAWDRMQIADRELVAPVVRYFTSGLFADRGSRGVDLVDYLDGWFCGGHGSTDLVRGIVAEGRRFPYDFAPRPACPKPRPPLLATLDARGRLTLVAHVPGEVTAQPFAIAAGGPAPLGPPRRWTVPAGRARTVELARPPAAERRFLSITLASGGRRWQQALALDPEPPSPPVRAGWDAEGRALAIHEVCCAP